MKKLSSVDVHFMVKEMQDFVGARFDKAFQDGHEFVIISLHKQGKFFLNFQRPGLLFHTFEKPKCEVLYQFAQDLRKHLVQGVLKSVEQRGLERIIFLVFQGKDWKRELVIELFDKGNMILLEGGQVISSLSSYTFKERSVKRRVEYNPPESRADIRLVNSKEALLILSPIERNIAASLATRFGLGGQFAEELCLRAGIDKSKKEISKDEVKVLQREAKIILESNPEPHSIFENEKLVDITPIRLRKYKDFDNKQIDSFIQALVAYKGHIETKKEVSLAKANTILQAQIKKRNEVQSKINAYNSQAECLYENYQKVDTLLKELEKFKKKKQLLEFLESLKSKGIILSFSQKDKKLEVEL